MENDPTLPFEEVQVGAPPTAPRVFRGLRVHSQLGAGGMGTTWLASHPVLRVPFVVKRFQPQAATAEALFREAAFAARANSPFVASVVDAGVEQGEPFVVQRYVDGLDLEELVRRFGALGRPMPLGVVVRAVADAARGLHAIHQAGVVHRDVKPANLFLSGGGETLVGDFGIAVEARAPSLGEGLAGTPPFMAPEQWDPLAPERVDRHADVYALGVAAHRLATGAFPFVASDLRGYRDAHLTTLYTPPRSTEPRAAYFFAVVERALAKSPAQRWPNADAFARALATIAERPPFPERIEDGVRFGDLSVRLLHTDILEAVERLQPQVVVCAANDALRMRAGVADVLRGAAGDAVELEAATHAPAALGDVVFTSAGQLKALWMAHAVAAVEGAFCLQRCVLRLCLEAEARGAERIVMPALGTGIGRVPHELAAKLLFEALRTFASLRPRVVRSVDLALVDQPVYDRFRGILAGV